MSRVWFAKPLETAATWWRILRGDGITLGFTTHDRDLWFDGVCHAAAPGMVPSAIRRTADFAPDSAEVQGSLSHAAISAADLAAGRYDGARIMIGLVDWDSLERATLYTGTLGEISEEDGAFAASLISRKADLLRDPVPRTSPGCRAEFCGPGCNLSAAAFTRLAAIAAVDADRASVTCVGLAAPELYLGGALRWLDGPLAGLRAGIRAVDGNWLVLDRPIDQAPAAGDRVLLRQGCDKRLVTCSSRFGNAVNFHGEPFLPGNDRLARYPSA
jgi:uncharacterized phage protein (TIGR02218 family)